MMQLKPSVALVRAAILMTAAGILAVLSRRIEFVVLAAPFAVWCGFAIARRNRAAITVQQGLSGGRLALGQSVDFHLDVGPGDAIVALTVPRPARCVVEPPLGATVGVGSAAIRVRPDRWGRHTIEPGEAAITDGWGMWTGYWQPPQRAVTVAPALDSPGGGDAIPHPIGLVGIHQSRVRGEGSDLAEVRPFVTGDRLRRINWRVTSRTGRVHTNATTAERDTEVVVVLDTTADIVANQQDRNDTGTASSSSLDIAVAAAATIADHYLRLGDRVSVHDLGRVVGSVPPGAGARQRAIITERLAKGWTDRISFSALRPTKRLRAGSLVICCTPLLDDAVLDEVLRLLHRGAAVVVIDTLPPALGNLATKPGGAVARWEDRFRSRRFWDEAWALRRIEREGVLDRMKEIGVPVVAWRGITSLSQLIAALAANRSAPRMVRR